MRKVKESRFDLPARKPRFDIARLSDAHLTECYWYHDRFVGYQTVAFTWTMKQGLGEPGSILTPELALKVGADCLHRLQRSQVRKHLLDRRRFIVWAERGSLGRLHLHGLVAVPHNMTPDQFAFMLDASWKDKKNKWHLRHSDYVVPETKDDVLGWIGYMFKRGYDSSLVSF